MARRTIALLYSPGLGYCRGILHAIAAATARRTDWDPVLIAPERAGIDLARLRPDGIIAHLFDRSLTRTALRPGVPVISTCGLSAAPGVPRVQADDHLVGRMAAGHLLAGGLRSFAYIGHRGQDASRRRATGVREAIAALGLELPAWWVSAGRGFDPHGTAPLLDRSVLDFIRPLMRPLGVVCASDIMARQLLDLMHGELAVPREVAVIGVDDDDLLCRLARPALTSVQLATDAIGRQAVEHLADWLDHDLRPPRETLVPPRQVVVRASTDRDVGVDPELAAALVLTRPVHELAARAAVSRRTLERRARDRFGRGLAAERRQRRLAEAQRLLAAGRVPIAEIATRTGFSSHSQLVRTFRRETGMTPGAWRRGSTASR